MKCIWLPKLSKVALEFARKKVEIDALELMELA